MTRDHRRLAAIVSADVVGYSLLMGRDDSGTLAELRGHRQELIDPKISEHNGRIVKTTGDGLLLESPVWSMRCGARSTCSVAWPSAMPVYVRSSGSTFVSASTSVRSSFENEDIFGDGVNVAARLQELAAPGGICVSGRVHEDAHGKLDVTFEDAGEQKLKNIARPVRVHRILLGEMPGGSEVATATPTKPPLALPDRPSIAVLPFQNMSGDPEQEYFADGMVLARRFEDAKAMLLRALQEHPAWAPTHRFLMSCYAHMGRLDEAREAVRQLRTITNVVMPSASHWRNPEHRELFLSGLRLAAGESG